MPGGYAYYGAYYDAYYTEWPTAADARQWPDDQAGGGPSLDGITQWADGGAGPQGPLHTRAAGNGTVYAMSAYADRPYSFDVIARSLDDSRRMVCVMRLLPAVQIPA